MPITIALNLQRSERPSTEPFILTGALFDVVATALQVIVGKLHLGTATEEEQECLTLLVIDPDYPKFLNKENFETQLAQVKAQLAGQGTDDINCQWALYVIEEVERLKLENKSESTVGLTDELYQIIERYTISTDILRGPGLRRREPQTTDCYVVGRVSPASYSVEFSSTAYMGLLELLEQVSKVPGVKEVARNFKEALATGRFNGSAFSYMLPLKCCLQVLER